jgi:hypothetical protein
LKKLWADNVAATSSPVLQDGNAETNDSVLTCAKNNHCCNGYATIRLTKHKCFCSCHHLRRQFTADTNTGAIQQPLRTLEFKTAKEPLIQKLSESRNNKISTSSVAIKLKPNGHVQYIKKEVY